MPGCFKEDLTIRHRRLFAFALAAPTFLLTACAPAVQVTPQAGTDMARVNETLLGIATLDGPLVGATVRITALDGTSLGTPETHADDTHETGAFIITGAETPRDFRVVATGGTVNGQPFTDELRAEVRNHRAFGGYVALNPITTLISAYMAAHPEKSLEEATKAVKTFLALPAVWDVGLDLKGRPEFFDAAAYRAQAEGRGGHLAFAQALVAELDAGGTHPLQAPRPFRVMQEAEVAEEGAASLLGQEMAKSAASGGSQAAVGYALTTLLGGGATADGGLEKIQQSLDAINTKLNDLELQVENATNTILKDARSDTYDGVLATYASTLFTPYEIVCKDLHTMSYLDPVNDAAEVAHYGKKLQDELDANFDGQNLVNWDIALREANGGSSLIRLWSRKINGASPYFYSYNTAYQMQTWWDHMDAQQLNAVRLQLELLHSRGASQAEVRDVLGQYQTQREGQLRLLRGMIRKTDKMDLSAIGLPVHEIPLKAIPGQPVHLSPEKWSVIIQKKNPGNGNRVLVWRTSFENAKEVEPTGGLEVHIRPRGPAIAPGSHRGSTVPSSDKTHVWILPKVGLGAAFPEYRDQIERCRANAANKTGIHDVEWDLGRTNEVTSLYRNAGSSHFGDLGFNLAGDRVVYTSPIPMFGDIDAPNYIDFVYLEPRQVATYYRNPNWDWNTTGWSPSSELSSIRYDRLNQGPRGAALLRYPASADAEAAWWYE